MRIYFLVLIIRILNTKLITLNNNMKTQSGFSIIELIVVVTLIAVSASIILPGIQNMYISSRITSKTNDLIVTLNYLKTNAMTRPNAGLQLIPATTGWSHGWQVEQKTDTPPNKIVQIFEFGNDQVNINLVDSAGSSITTPVVYLSRGRVQQTIGYNFLICSTKSLIGRRITIDHRGTISTEHCALTASGECPGNCT